MAQKKKIVQNHSFLLCSCLVFAKLHSFVAGCRGWGDQREDACGTTQPGEESEGCGSGKAPWRRQQSCTQCWRARRERAGARSSAEFICTALGSHHQLHIPRWAGRMDLWDEDEGASCVWQLWGHFHSEGHSQVMSQDLLKDNTRDHPLAQVVLTGNLTFTAAATHVFHT